jgi:uncharacterized delta-60 repeat protein
VITHASRNFDHRSELSHRMAVRRRVIPRSLPVAAGLFAIALAIPLAALAGRGDADRSFGGDGIAQLGGDTVLRAAAVQRNGKLVAVGEQGRRGGAVRILVARFNRNGSLDRSFRRTSSGSGLPLLGGGGGGGIYVGPRGTTAKGVAIQRDGKIVVAGARTDNAGEANRGMLVLRLRANGSLDRSFSGNGMAIVFGSRRGEANAVALSGQKIVIAGSASLAGQRDAFARIAVARFKANGARDRRFGNGGALVVDYGRLTFANAVAVRGDGRIVLAGSQRHDLQTTNLLVARLRPGGARDRSFSGDSVFLRQFAQGAAFSAAFDIALARRGKIVVAGAATSSADGSDAIALRLKAGGAPDRSFGGNGITYLRATADRDQFNRQAPFPGAYGVALFGNRVVLGGFFDELGSRRLAVWGLNGRGRVDRGFGQNGRTVQTVGQGSAQLNDLVRAGNRIYGVGQTSDLFDPSTGLAARYQGR